MLNNENFKIKSEPAIPHTEDKSREVEKIDALTVKEFLGRVGEIAKSIIRVENNLQNERKDFLNEVGQVSSDDREGLAEQLEPAQKKFKKARETFLKNLGLHIPIISLCFRANSDNSVGKQEIYELRNEAHIQLLENGITDFQRRHYFPGVSELLERGILAKQYGVKEKIKKFVPNLVLGKYRYAFSEININATAIGQLSRRNDAWRMYLGLPQKNNTFGISDYKPEQSSEDKYYYKINEFVKNYKEPYGMSQKIVVQSLLNATKSHPNFPPEDFGSHVMGFYKLSAGIDKEKNLPYISYYDKWDLSIPGADVCFGPFEIYDRIYYNPKTYEIIENP
ncbi:MAG: hypothetical protein AAB740_02075 [Patescibacteria group bacterium]